MRFFARIRASIGYMIRRNLDLVGLWLALLVAQHFVAPTHVLARDDLLPWMALTVSGIAVLRGRLLGAGPHPMLTKRQPEFPGYLHKGALALVPWALMAVHDFGRTLDVQDLGKAMAASILVLVLLGMASGYNRTAWRPGSSTVLSWTFGMFFVGGLAFGTGFLRFFLEDTDWVRAVTEGPLLGLFFLAIGLAGGRSQNSSQRRRAGRKDNRPYRALVFPSLLAITGPGVGLGALYFFLPGLDFRFGFAVALLAIVWAAVIWQKQVPVAVACMLHEVLPLGGRDSASPNSAKPFDQPPDGSLRFNPLRVRRTRVMHAWYVPVKASRIADLDDPVRPLWPVPPPAVSYHILGDAAFEPDQLTKGPQWDHLTIRMKNQEDASGMSEGGADAAKTRRMVVLRPFSIGTLFRRAMTRTYRWDPRVPADAVQVLDNNTESATLMDGDVLLLSTEGVAHAYEFEVGAPVYQAPGALNARPPQLGDYVTL